LVGPGPTSDRYVRARKRGSRSAPVCTCARTAPVAPVGAVAAVPVAPSAPSPPAARRTVGPCRSAGTSGAVGTQSRPVCPAPVAPGDRVAPSHSRNQWPVGRRASSGCASRACRSITPVAPVGPVAPAVPVAPVVRCSGCTSGTCRAIGAGGAGRTRRSRACQARQSDPSRQAVTRGGRWDLLLQRNRLRQVGPCVATGRCAATSGPSRRRASAPVDLSLHRSRCAPVGTCCASRASVPGGARRAGRTRAQWTCRATAPVGAGRTSCTGVPVGASRTIAVPVAPVGPVAPIGTWCRRTGRTWCVRSHGGTVAPSDRCSGRARRASWTSRCHLAPVCR
jgi:hypothetical protein